jgi:hypothetical protein
MGRRSRLVRTVGGERRCLNMSNKTNERRRSAVETAVPERRSHLRYPFTAAAELEELHSGTKMAARSSDLSRGGCYLDTINPFPLGTVVKLRLTKERKTFEVQATVVYLQPGMGMHVMFTAAGPEQLWTLEKWLAELSGEVQPEVEAPEQREQPDQAVPKERSEARPKGQQSEVLNDLIVALTRKGVLTHAEGKAMMRKLGVEVDG